MNSGIYQIKNTINGKIYVGEAMDIDYRWLQHRSALEKGCHANSSLQADYEEYGKEAFEFSVLEYVNDCPKDVDLHSLLLVKEREWGEKLKVFSDKGYNISRFYTGGVKNKLSIYKKNTTYTNQVKLYRAWVTFTDCEEEAVAYIGLKIMYDKMVSLEDSECKKEVVVNFNIDNLYYELSGSLKPNKTDRAKLRKGIEILIDDGAIELIDTDDEDNYVLNVANFSVSKGAYTIITQEEIRNIFNLGFKQNYGLLGFAIGLFTTIDKKHKCGRLSYQGMQEVIGCPRKTCLNLSKILEENKIIYICHCVNRANSYGKYKDREYVEAYRNSKQREE